MDNEEVEELFELEDNEKDLNNDLNKKTILHNSNNNLSNNKLFQRKNYDFSKNKLDIKKNNNDILNNVRNQNINAYNALQSDMRRKNNSLKNNVAKTALKSIGVPSNIADDVSKEVDTGKGLTTHVSTSKTMFLHMKPVIYIMAGISLISFILIFVAIMINNNSDGDLDAVNKNFSLQQWVVSSETNDSTLVSLLKEFEYCDDSDDDDECLESPAGKYFKKLKELYKQYSSETYNNVKGITTKLNIPLILQTLSYGITDSELFDEEEIDNTLKKMEKLAEAQVEHYKEYGYTYQEENGVCTKTWEDYVGGTGGQDYYRISMDKYFSYLLYGEVHENYSKSIKEIDVITDDSGCRPSDIDLPEGGSIEEISEGSYGGNMTSYDGNIENGYIYKNIIGNYDISDGTLKNQVMGILKEIFQKSNETDYTDTSSVMSDIPVGVDSLKKRFYFTNDMNLYRKGTLFGQCVWYAKHRAMEIIAASKIDEKHKEDLIKSINDTSGNGIDWYKNPKSEYFEKSKDINKPRCGSIVSWEWNDDMTVQYGANYGHVAIVERVYTLNGQTMVTLTEGWRAKCSGSDIWCETSESELWSVVRFQRKELTLPQLQVYSGRFNGYVYLLGSETESCEK